MGNKIDAIDIENVKLILEIETKSKDKYQIVTNNIKASDGSFNMKIDGKHFTYDFWVE